MMIATRVRPEGSREELSRAAAIHDHVAQFYESAEFAHAIASGFVAAGIRAGQPALAFLAPGRREACLARLSAAGIDVERALRERQLAFLDAAETLAAVMVDGAPDPERFRLLVGGAVEGLAGGPFGTKVRAYVELADVLGRRGEVRAAVALEGMWNDLAGSHPMSTLCSFAIDACADESHTRDFQELLTAHAYVVPAESWAQAGDADARLREVVRLQYRAQALERELERRRGMEAALREALEDKKRLEERMRAQNEELARAVRLSETFVGMLGHDLRNPLNAIATAAALVARRSQSETISRPATRIVRSSRRMARMIDQILDFTRIRLGRGLPLEPRRVDLADVCRLVIEELEGENPAPRVRLEARGEVAGVWDGDRLAQLVSNLVGNALLHGRAEAPVTLLLDGTGEEDVLLEVANAGYIPQELLPGIFEPFVGATPSARHASHGLGLGLHISRQIATAHGGSIDATCSDGWTRFVVRLPRTTVPGT